MKLAFGSLLVVTLLLVPSCKGIQESNKQADALAEEVLNKVAAGEADELYNTMGAAELREQVAIEKWRTVIGIGHTLGKPLKWQRTSFDLKTANGVTTGEYEYDVTWEKGSGTFSLKAKKEGDSWKVLGVKFDSDALRNKRATSNPS